MERAAAPMQEAANVPELVTCQLELMKPGD